MDELPDSLLLHILSRLDELADVARCRVAWKAFDTVFPGLQSINLRCSLKWHNSSNPSVSFKKNFLDIISKLEAVDSLCIGLDGSLISNLHNNDRHDPYLTDEDFAKEWLPMVSKSLKSLSISDYYSQHPSNVLPLISAHCHKLINLKLDVVHLSMDNMNPMLMLTSLTLEDTDLADERLNEWFPNLQVLQLVRVTGLEADPMIHLLNLKTCVVWDLYDNMGSLTVIAPKLITLKFASLMHTALHVEAPMLSLFYVVRHTSVLTVKKFENLKTLWLDIMYIGDILSKFPITRTVETLTLESRSWISTDATYSKLTLGKVFKVFPNVSSLCIKSGAWSELEACLNPQGWEILDGRKGLKTICAYLKLVDPSLDFSSVACVLDQCVGLLEVSLFTPDDVYRYDDTIEESFMSKCMARWPGLKWRWEMWSHYTEEEQDYEPW